MIKLEGKSLKSHKKKMIVPILVTVLLILYDIAYFALLISLFEGLWKYALGIIPVVISCVMIWVCAERIFEIKKGEEDDLSQY